MAIDTDSIRNFFNEITHDLYSSLYLAIGGDLEEETRDWTSRAVEFASTAIKIVILLTVLGLLYWLAVYIINRNQERFKLSDKRLNILRSGLRYIWVVGCLLAVMSQLNVQPTTIKATAKASIWAGIYYVLWASSEHIITRILKHYGLNASIEQLLKNVLSVLIVVLGLASVMAQFGFDIVSLVAGLGIVGLAVGFAAQSTLANFIAGITILLEQSFQVGDWIDIAGKEGRVIVISLRTTHILTRDNVTVILPNSTVASSEVINITSKSFIRFNINVRIALESDIETARQVILSIVEDIDPILKRPPPSATISEISDFGVIFIVRFWVGPGTVARIPSIKEQLYERIKDAFQAADIAIPYPHMRILMPKDVEYPIKTKPFAVETQNSVADMSHQSESLSSDP